MNNAITESVQIRSVGSPSPKAKPGVMADTGPCVDQILARYSPEPASLISVLEDLQEELHYLPREALERISATLSVPRNQMYHVATFFKAFSLTAQGRHTVCVCRGTACHVQGADKIMEMLQSQLNVPEDGTSEDGRFTVRSVRCLGCCALAPALMIDRDVHGRVASNELRDILDQYSDDDRND